MPIALFVIGAFMLIAGLRDKQDQLTALVAEDLPGFVPWIISVGAVGAIGYAPSARKFSDALLVLILAAAILARGTGLIYQFNAALSGRNSTPVPKSYYEGAPRSTAIPPAGAEILQFTR